MSQGSQSQPSMETEDDLLDWIESGANHDEELRQVLKYLVFLNASAVQKAIRYVERGKHHPHSNKTRRNVPLEQVPSSPLRATVTATTTAPATVPTPPVQPQHQQHQQPTPPRVPSLHTNHTTPVNLNIPNHSVIVAKSSPQTRPSPQSPQPPPTPPPQQQLLVLCTSRPSCPEEGDDQDNAMKICREVAILPYIVLKESKPGLATELLQLSKRTHYPQFFWRTRQDIQEDESSDNPAVTTFLGDYSTVHRLHLQGLFRPRLDVLTSPAATTATTANVPSNFEGERRQLDFNTGIPPLPSPRQHQMSSISSSAPSGPHSSGFNRPLLHNDKGSVRDEPNSALPDPPPPSTPHQPLLTASPIAMPQTPPTQPTQQPSTPIPTSTMAPTWSSPPQPHPVEPSRPPPPADGVANVRVVRPRASPLQRPSGHSEEPDDVTFSSSTKPPVPSPSALRRANGPQLEPEVPNSQPEHGEGTAPLPIADSCSYSSSSTADSASTQRQTNPTLTSPPSATLHHVEEIGSRVHTASSEPSRMTDDPLELPEPQSTLQPVVDAISSASSSDLSTSFTATTTARTDTAVPAKNSMQATSSDPPLNHHYPKLPLPLPQTVVDTSSTTKWKKAIQTTPSEPTISQYPKLPIPAQPVIDTSSSNTASSNRWKTTAPTISSEAQVNRYPKLPVPVQPAAETATTRSTNLPVNRPMPPSKDEWTTNQAPPESSELTTAIDSTIPSPIPPIFNNDKSSNTTTPLMENPTSAVPVEPPIPPVPKRIISQQQPPGVGACYLVYDAVRAELNIFYSEFFMDGSVGVWTTPHIKAFKEAQGLGQSEMIGNCASGVQDPQQYCQGWCQFIMAAKSMEATVMILLFDVGGGMPVDFYLYSSGTTKLVQSGDFETENIDAVACLPKNADFSMNLKGKKWSKAAKKLGSVAVFRSLSVNANGSTSNTNHKQMPDTPSTVGTPATPLTESSDGFHSDFRDKESPPSSPMLPAPSSVPTSPRRLEPDTSSTPLPSASVSDPGVTSISHHDGYLSAAHAPNPPNGASYLIYDPDSSGRLVEHCSKTPVPDAIGRWVPQGSKKLSGFKFTQNLGRTVLIGNCSAGVQGRKNYSSGWCQFIRSARVMEAEVMMWDPVAKGLMVDVYLYQDDPRPNFQTVKLLPGVAQSVDKTLAVACIPKNTPFYEGMCVDILKWLADGSNYGASSRF